MSTDPQAAELFDTFPRSAWTELPATDRAKMMRSYMGGMWGGFDSGTAAFASGKPRVVAGKYKHDDFRQHFHRWPVEVDAAVNEALTLAASGRDVYVNPMLRIDRQRRKDNGAGGRWAWADLDGPMTSERLTLLDSLGDTVRCISSGTGHHVYLELDEWRTPTEVEVVNRALADMLGGDSKWSNESLLRLPGTFNLKPLIFHGKTPALVQVVKL